MIVKFVLLEYDFCVFVLIQKMEIIDNREFQILYEKSKNLIDSARNNMGQMANTITVLTSFCWEDILHTPYVLEFAGLEDKAAYHESDLESVVIEKMQKFLLELGKGFLFEQRQKRFSFNDKNFYVDLVLYYSDPFCQDSFLINLSLGGKRTFL